MSDGMQEVELPNGRIVPNVPSTMTNSQLLDMLSKQGDITTEEAAAWGQGTLSGTETPVADELGAQTSLPSESLQGMGGAQGGPSYGPEAGPGEMIMGNLDVPGGIAGAIGGAKAGVPFGPYGVLAGTVGGGFAGTFGGEILSDYFMSREVDMEDATKNAAIGAGVEIITLGAASKFKAAMKVLGFEGNEIAQLWQTYTKKKPAPGDPQALPMGSNESLVQTQNLLEDGGGSLTAYQTGQAGAASNVMEGLGQMGVVSGRSYDALDAKNATIIRDQIDNIINDTLGEVDSANIGASVHGIIQGGKKAAQQTYNITLDEIITRSGKKQVNPNWIAGTIKKFRKDGTKDFGSVYEPETLRLMDEYEEIMSELPTMSVDSLLAFQKKLNARVTQLGEFGATQNTKASAELAQLSSKMRDTTGKLLENVDPQAYKVYKNGNAAYGEAMEGLLPKLNANVITRADTGDYEAIARVLEGKNPDQIEAFMKSIDTAYNQAKIAGVDMAQTARYATPAQARTAIKQGWMKNIFGESTEGAFDPVEWQRKAAFYEKPSNARAAQAILGEDWPAFKMLLNAMAESSSKQTGFVGSLVLRSKEATNAAQLVGGGATAAASIPAAAAIFFGPVLLSKIASRPAAVRALLEGNKKSQAAKVAGRTELFATITEETMRAVYNMLTPEEQTDVREDVRKGNQ